MLTFQTTRYAFPGGPWGCFSVVGRLKSRLGKLASKSADSRYTQFLIGKEARLRRRTYLCMSVIYRLCLAFTVCIQSAFKLQVKGLFTWVRKDKQIYIHTYMHAYTNALFVKQFQETRCAWFKNNSCTMVDTCWYKKIKYWQSCHKVSTQIWLPNCPGCQCCVWFHFVQVNNELLQSPFL